jgi:methylenetetrahydrofolate reductase (NADPH)
MRMEDFVITATLPVSGTATGADIRTLADALQGRLCAVHVDADRAAEGPPDAMAIASLTLGRGLDAVVHLTCRDRNRLALKAGLLGFTAIGVGSLVLSRGQKLPDELRGKVKGVFDTTTLQLIEMARHIRDTVAPELYIGSRVSVIRPAADWQASEARKRIAAGVQFLQTLPCLNTGMLQAYLQRLVALKITHHAAVIVDVPILTSTAAAAKIAVDYPGARIPAAVLRRLEAAADPRAEGIAIAADALRTYRSTPGVTGANLVGETAAVTDVLAAAEVS